jgi:hypothetical protein
MTLPRSAPRPFGKRDPLIVGDDTYPAEVVDGWLLETMQRVDGKHHPETGHYAHTWIRGLESRADAEEIKKAIHRCGFYMFKKGWAHIMGKAWVHKNPDGTFSVEFAAIHKDFAYAHVIKTYGPDPSKWPYSTNRFHPNYG